MKEKITEAVEYANSSNELENNNLSDIELNKIIKDIETGKTDKSFLYSVVEFIKRTKTEKKDEKSNVKTRK